MNLVTITPPAPIPQAQAIAENLLAHLNAELARRAESHAARYVEFWDSAETPDAILAAMGDQAIVWLQTASESVDHMGRLAQIAGGTVLDVLPAELLLPRRAFVVSNVVTSGDGRILSADVTLDAPAEGFDAWGRAIVAPE